MRRIFAVVLLVSVASPSYAFLGIGDITFDPTTYGEVVKQYEEMQKIYHSARESVDKLASIENTIKEAQQAYDTLASGDLKRFANDMQLDTSNVKSVAGLRAEIANLESKGGQVGDYAQYQLSLIGKLENLTKLQKASSNNVQQASGKTNPTTSAAITAQSTATLAALAAAEEQRHIQEDYDRQKIAKGTQDSIAATNSIYKAIGK